MTSKWVFVLIVFVLLAAEGIIKFWLNKKIIRKIEKKNEEQTTQDEFLYFPASELFKEIVSGKYEKARLTTGQQVYEFEFSTFKILEGVMFIPYAPGKELYVFKEKYCNVQGMNAEDNEGTACKLEVA